MHCLGKLGKYHTGEGEDSYAAPTWLLGFPGGSAVKNLPAIQEAQEMYLQFLGRKIPWRRKWQPTPVFLPGKSHGQKSMWATVHGIAESEVTEQACI